MPRYGMLRILTFKKPCIFCGESVTAPWGGRDRASILPGECACCHICVIKALVRMTIIRHGDVGYPKNQLFPGAQGRLRRHDLRVRDHYLNHEQPSRRRKYLACLARYNAKARARRRSA